MTTFRALRALYWLHEHRDQPVAALPAEVVPPEDARIVFDELVEQGSVHDTSSMGGGPDGSFDFLLTPKGRIHARNARDTYRHELALRRVLELMEVSSHWEPARFQLSPAADDFSGRLSDREIREATHYLVDLGLCEGSKTANQEFYHVEITPRGRAVARRPHLIDGASAPSGPITNVSADNYGTLTVGNQVIGGQGHTVSANVTQGASLDKVLEAINQLRSDVEVAPDIDDDDRGELIEEIDKLTAKAAKRGLDWVKASLVALGTQLADSAGQELANQALHAASLIG